MEMVPSFESIAMLALKPKLDSIPSCPGRSDILVRTAVPVGENPRRFYLQHVNDVQPPVISHSEWVPRVFVEHLMRNKKNSAIGVKFLPGRNPPDQITNMEGALHTFVTPVVLPCYIHGDYAYRGGHCVVPLKNDSEFQHARTVLLSAAVQPDFENKQVMLALAALSEDEVRGELLPDSFSLLDTMSKQDPLKRAKYDNILRCHMIACLTQGRRLPDVYEASQEILSQQDAVVFLESHVSSPNSKSDDICRKFARLKNSRVVSLEILFNTSLHQLRNEISALEAVSPQGYVYTSDPPSIFAQEADAILLNRLQFAALKHLSTISRFTAMKTFGFNDYADDKAVELLKHSLVQQEHIQVVPKSALFGGTTGAYVPLPGTESALLVIHNNSDAFGQNIESEWASGSLDGAIGANSSAAASLFRQREDLLDHLF